MKYSIPYRRDMKTDPIIHEDLLALDVQKFDAFSDHERVFLHHHKASGLKAIIAVHNTNLGPALGGARFWHYAHQDLAVTDALRLSKGMTYKNALAGLDLGGGKAVIMADQNFQKDASLLRAFGRSVDYHQGAYITAEDVGMSVDDMHIIMEKTSHIGGITANGALGDPSPYTAIGVFSAIQASVKFQRGNHDLNKKVIAIQGLGSVGFELARMCHEAGARLIVTDIDADRIAAAQSAFGAQSVDQNRIYGVNADVFAPCALGGILNDQTIPMLQAPIIAGAANNQLLQDEDAERLDKRGILYVPDYVANAGGVISIGLGKSQSDHDDVVEQCRAIGDRCMEIFQTAKAQNNRTVLIADQMAEKRFAP